MLKFDSPNAKTGERKTEGERGQRREGGRERERKKIRKGKEKWKKRKRGKRDIRSADFAVATAAELAHAPIGRDARDEDEQGDGTAMNSDVGSDFSGDRAGNDFEWTELND